MTTKPFLDERRLRRALEAQSFTLKPTSDGFRILAPDGVGTTSFHPSMLAENGSRSYRNFVADLRRIGFDFDRITPPKASAEAWRREREEIDQMIQGSLAEAEAQGAEIAARQAADVDLAQRLTSLHEGARRIYDLVRAEPGLTPREYAAKIDDPLIDRSRVSHDAKPLRDLGLIETTGQTMSVRYWIAGEIDLEKIPAIQRAPYNGRRAGPVRVRQIEPADPVVRFRRMGEKAIKLKAELEEIVVAMVEEYARQETELVELRRKRKRLEETLGRAVDNL